VSALLLWLLLLRPHAATVPPPQSLFWEDFETCSAGDLGGQHGWTLIAGSDPLASMNVQVDASLGGAQLSCATCYGSSCGIHTYSKLAPGGALPSEFTLTFRVEIGEPYPANTVYLGVYVTDTDNIGGPYSFAFQLYRVGGTDYYRACVNWGGCQQSIPWTGPTATIMVVHDSVSTSFYCDGGLATRFDSTPVTPDRVLLDISGDAPGLFGKIDDIRITSP